MADVSRSERTIFIEALDLQPGDQRQQYLDGACGDDDQLRARIESLLSAHDSPQTPLARFGFDDADLRDRIAIIQQGSVEMIGDRIGPYKLLEQIGEGGFAVVFLAEQQKPVRRRVALKIIKPGMDTRQVIARFEAERQALAMMDHPNIAKVFSAGTTDSGRPFFVMELVQGVPITEYCDQCNLATRDRLRLFIVVCEAVQHAHQKGVIHRDIKPTNVMVAILDGRPAPKVIDFGVAKAISQRLTEHSIVTGFSQIIGTPLYMSPEQAELSPLGVDTRSDIYSLGVLFYELLVGTTPFEKDRLLSAPYHELRRIICEEEPLRPSARFSTLAVECATTVAEHRRTDQRRLVQVVGGDLDWIAMKCLEKDRSRRYETASGLARDIERYLNDEPVRACPPSAAYRFGKFARRNKLVLAGTSAVVVALLMLVVGLAVSNRIITAEQNEKTQALVEKEQALMLAEEERQHAEKNFRRARIAVRGILSDAARGAGEWSQLPPPLREKFAESAVNFYEGFLEEGSVDPSLQYETAVGYRSISAMYNSLGKREQAEQLLRDAIVILQRLSEKYPEEVRYRHQLAYTLYMHGWRLDLGHELSEAEASLRRSVDQYETLVSERPDHGSYYLELAACYRVLIRLQDKRGQFRDARRSALRLRDLMRKAAFTSPSISDLEMVWRLELLPNVPPASPIAPNVAIGVAQALIDVGRREEALAACREIVRTKPDDAAARYQLAYALETNGQYDEAIVQLEKAIDLVPDYSDAHNGLAWLLSTCPNQQFWDSQRAVARAMKAVELAPKNAAFWNTLGVARYRAGDFELSIEALNKALELREHDSFVMFFLAMAKWQLGSEDSAREIYRGAVEWMEIQRPDDEVLLRFRNEAASLLGIPKT